MKRALLPLALLAATAATAQTVYRCGPAGSEYRQTPCAGGQIVNVADPRSEAQRSEAAQRTQRDAALLQELRRDQPTPAAATPQAPAAHARPTSTAAAKKKSVPRQQGKRHQPAEGARIARGPKPEKTAAARPAKPHKADKTDQAAQP